MYGATRCSWGQSSLGPVGANPPAASGRSSQKAAARLNHRPSDAYGVSCRVRTEGCPTCRCAGSPGHRTIHPARVVRNWFPRHRLPKPAARRSACPPSGAGGPPQIGGEPFVISGTCYDCVTDPVNGSRRFSYGLLLSAARDLRETEQKCDPATFATILARATGRPHGRPHSSVRRVPW
jgi:hypothetical protein